ncbi:methylamine utilization protein [Halomonas sp. V046]|uniref:methylamine utilization protein n=1 Tax=Halomonas sp. V046 TaxID=3459611 RepID=UPI004043D11F
MRITAPLPLPLVLSFALLMLSASALAASIRVIDAETGEPLADAVVELSRTEASPGPGQGEHEGVFEIAQRHATFVPLVTVLPVGSKVIFPNRDSSRHHVYSFSPAKVFDLELYLSETPPPVAFERPGVVVLGCNIHDHMRAFVVVSDGDRFAMTDARGRADFPAVEARNQVIRVWHPRLEDTHQRWWQGRLVSATQEVALELEARLMQPAPPSDLQRRFDQALQARDAG